MSNRARRAHTHALRRRLLPESGLLTIEIRIAKAFLWPPPPRFVEPPPKP